MKYPPITLELLKSKEACQEQLDLFKTYFGNTSVPLNKKVFTKLASQFDIVWAADHLLDRTDLVEYEKVRDTAWGEHKKVTALAFLKLYKAK